MKTPRLRVGLYLHNPQANILKFVRCLRDWEMSFTSLYRDELKDLKPGAVDVLLLHGGWYGIDRVPGQNQHDKQELPEHRPMADAVRRFVRAGGGIVGVCCGAYNVVWLGLIAADISRAHGVGMHSLEVVNEKHPIVRGVIERAKGRKDRKWLALPVIRVSGPIFFPRDPKQMVMSYDWEQRLGAILAGSYGNGRAVAISPHPEATEHELDTDVLREPPMKAAGLLKNALYWSAGWPIR
jgi:hypothetical protein